MSVFLSIGSLSAKTLWHKIEQFEQDVTANESTYWLKFELLWREYFQWWALEHSHRLFNFTGVMQRNSLTSFYPHRFQMWCHGRTEYALVNACMNQLRSTGFMSNRGRQIVASCLVHDLKVDWRYGAAFFQQHLLDYDVASNWGNWQYIAGVGSDPRGGRHFNIAKQTQIYDPDHQFINKWTINSNHKSEPLQKDVVDAADWPIVSHSNSDQQSFSEK